MNRVSLRERATQLDEILCDDGLEWHIFLVSKATIKGNVNSLGDPMLPDKHAEGSLQWDVSPRAFNTPMSQYL